MTPDTPQGAGRAYSKEKTPPDMASGGARKGSGRKKKGTAQWSVRVNPKTKAAIKAEAKKRGLKTPGEVLDQDYGK